MKVGVSMWSMVSYATSGRMDVPGFIRYAHEIGADGVELLDYFWRGGADELAAVEAALRETGLGVSAYAVGNDFVQPDAERRARQVQHIRDGVDMAVRLRCSLLRVFAGDAKAGVSFEDGRRWIVEGLRDAADYAAQNGVTLALENHGLFAGRADQVRGIADAVGSPFLRATIDTGNFLLVGQDPVAAVADLAPLAAYVHLKDFRSFPNSDAPEGAYTGLGGVQCLGTVIGAGDVNLDGVLAALRAAGYDGWLSIEYDTDGEVRRGMIGYSHTGCITLLHG